MTVSSFSKCCSLPMQLYMHKIFTLFKPTSYLQYHLEYKKPATKFPASFFYQGLYIAPLYQASLTPSGVYTVWHHWNYNLTAKWWFDACLISTFRIHQVFHYDTYTSKFFWIRAILSGNKCIRHVSTVTPPFSYSSSLFKQYNSRWFYLILCMFYIHNTCMHVELWLLQYLMLYLLLHPVSLLNITYLIPMFLNGLYS